jgi:hypothetical protein
MRTRKKMKTYKVSFKDTFHNCESEGQAYDALMEYLAICVRYGDVDAFDFQLVHCTSEEV